MPFVQRIVEPRYLSRTTLFGENGKPLVSDDELQAVTNNTLSNALRQLASLVLVANDIFNELTAELCKVAKRSDGLKKKIGEVEEKVIGYDPKKVTVPEGDLSSFSVLKEHYGAPKQMDTQLFSAESRSSALREMYEAAAKTPVHTMRQLDRWRRDGHRSSRFFMCTPVLGEKRRRIKAKVDIDIETRMPAAVEELRRWTSAEALGDITVTPDNLCRIPQSLQDVDGVDAGATSGDDEGIDHKLPSPEEQLQVIALKFPAELVAVDVSGRRFDRMLVQRRSLLHTDITYEEQTEGGTVRRRARSRKPRGKRRNTLAGTDQKEIRDALTARDEPSTSGLGDPDPMKTAPVVRSKSSDLFRTKRGSPPDKKSHFNSLKQWGKNRLKMMNRSWENKDTTKSPPKDIDDINIYETVTMRRRRSTEKEERKTSCSSSEKSSSVSLPISTPFSAAMNLAVKLRESSLQRRQRRTTATKEDQHSSSGNWSASSESGRASIGSEITNTTQSTTNPRSSTSAATSVNSLNAPHGPPGSTHSRRRFPHSSVSASSSVTSEGTLTPDIIHDFHDDGETSSVYSCDTEGYYTSFHVDSGLKTLKEEDPSLPMTPLHSSSAFSNSNGNCAELSAENEYELFGKGSTSTTTSSAGTVCTTLMAGESSRSLSHGPAVPERKSSLQRLDSNSTGSNSLERDYDSEKTGTVKRSPSASKEIVVALIHKQSDGDVSPDSGHNTSSSPIESVSSPNGVRSGSEFEFSESSDLEGVDRIERIRIKTTINSSRIPSMCVITPQNSDDESVENYEYRSKRSSEETNLNIPDLGSKNATKTKLNLPLQPLETDLDTLSFTDDNKTEKSRIVVAPINGTNKLQLINVNTVSGYATVETIETNKSVRAPSPSGGSITVREPAPEPPKLIQPIFKATLLPLNNMLGKLKSNITNFASRKEKSPSPAKPCNENPDLFDSGEYVTIADVRNNNEKGPIVSDAIYANDIMKSGQNKPVSVPIRESEYVSLNELPKNINNKEGTTLSPSSSASNSLERNRRQGARVMLDAEGKVVYSSDSLRRRKGAHTTFEPGPFVKDTNVSNSPLPMHRVTRSVRPVAGVQAPPSLSQRPQSPQFSKLVIRANSNSQSADFVRMPANTIVASMSPRLTNARGAYVNMQEDPRSVMEERALSSSNIYQIQQQQHQFIPPQGANLSPQINYQTNENPMVQRGIPMYRTLPNRRSASAYSIMEEQRIQSPDPTRNFVASQFVYSTLRPTYQDNRFSESNQQYTYNSLPRKQPPENQQFTSYPYHQYQYVTSVPVPQSPNYINQVPMKQSSPRRFSPIRKDPEYNRKLADNLEESLKISPIDPRSTAGFFSSTPAKKDELNCAVNLSNKLLSPKKSTMSNEELYAVIHKSKKKLNIKTEDDDISRSSPISSTMSLSPANSVVSLPARITPVKIPETGYLHDAKSRNSWSPNTDDAKISQKQSCSDRLGPKQTSRLDFKKLLLQQNSKSAPITTSASKLSAVEQLKLSKNQVGTKSPPPMNILDLSGSPKSLINRKFGGNINQGSPDKQRNVSKLLSPRSNWRFANPRTDVLSSTILEDCREDESSGSSSTEKNKSSPRSPALSNTNVTDLQKAGIRRQLIPNDSKFQNMSRSQYIQAQRAQFFNSSPVSSTSNNQIANQNSPNRHKMSPSSTLETAL